MNPNWKHEYLALAIEIDKLLTRYDPVGRVTALLHGYGKVVCALLHAEVNGGLDECYMEFPDAPVMEGCKHGERCYCDLLKEREVFIIQKGLWGEFLSSLSEGSAFPQSPRNGQVFLRTDLAPPRRFSYRDKSWHIIDGEKTESTDDPQTPGPT